MRDARLTRDARPITAPCFRALMIEPRDRADMIEPIEAADPMENSDAAEPIDPTDKIEPTEPTDRNDPRQPMHNTESSDQSDHFELIDATQYDSVLLDRAFPNRPLHRPGLGRLRHGRVGAVAHRTGGDVRAVRGHGPGRPRRLDHAGGDLVAWFKDPDGNVLSLTQLTDAGY
jgi:hypothetical protein